MNPTPLPAVQVLVLVVECEAGHFTLQISKLWLHRHIGTEQEAAQNIPKQSVAHNLEHVLMIQL